MSLPSPAPFEPEPSGGFLFEELIAPLDAERFFAEHWERRRLYVERAAPDYYARLFTLEDVDRALHVARSCPDDALSITAPKGSGKQREQVPAAKVTRERVYAAFCEGSTIRLGGVDRFWAPLALFKAALAERLSAGITVNLYLTPPSSQGFVAHYDNHDVFVLQLFGSKRWHLGEPKYELPGFGFSHLSARFPRQTLANDSPHLAESVLLRAGDLLYLPRGFYHKPVAEEEASLHLTVGVHPVYWGEVLARAVEFAALDQLPLRRALPPGFAGDPGARRSLAGTYAELARAFAGADAFADALDSLVREKCGAETAPGDGHFASLDRLESVGPETVVEKRHGLTCFVEERQDGAAIRFGQNFVGGPQALAPAFEFVRTHRRFRVADLPGPLSDRSKSVLARRLIREGLLRLGD
jgi:hypothetical protein